MLEKVNILLVEDDADTIKATSSILKKEGFSFAIADTGEAALKSLKEFEPDLILMDVVLPDYDGVELCREIKHKEVYLHIPIILISGYNVSTADETKGIEAGAEDYLIKPISNKRLIARINKSITLYYAYKKIQETTKFWQSTFANTNDAIMLLDKDFRVKIANQTMAKLFKMKADEMIGMYCWQIVHKSDDIFDACPSKKIRETKKREEIELELKGRWYKVSLDPIFSNGALEGVIHIITDITNRKLAEIKLKESEERYNLALEASADGIYDWNLKRNEIYFSPGYFKMLGYDPDEMEQKFETYQKLLHPDDAKESEKKLEKYMAGETEDNAIEMRFKSNKGDWVWILSRGKVVERDENGEVVRFVGTNVNIDRRKRAEEELEEYKENLEKIVVDRTKDLENKNKELAEKNKELEELNKLFIGRELRMQEMKKRIKELENKMKK